MNTLLKVLLSITIVLTTSQCSQRTAAPAPFLGPFATIDFNNAPEHLANSKYLNRQIMAGPNYAWHYSIAYMSCNDNCRENILVNAIDGTIIDVFYSCGKPEFQLESTILIVSAPQENADCIDVKYQLIDNALQLID